MAKNTEGQNPCICRASHRRPAWELPCPAGPQPPWDWGACLKCRRSKGPCSVLYEALAIDYRCWYKSVIWTLGRWSCVDHKLKAILGHMESWAWGKPGLPKTLSQNRKKKSIFHREVESGFFFFFFNTQTLAFGRSFTLPMKELRKSRVACLPSSDLPLVSTPCWNQWLPSDTWFSLQVHSELKADPLHCYTSWVQHCIIRWPFHCPQKFVLCHSCANPILSSSDFHSLPFLKWVSCSWNQTNFRVLRLAFHYFVIWFWIPSLDFRGDYLQGDK